MRIGIVTYHREDNYGAILQAYALQIVLEQLQHAVQIIDYVPGGVARRHSVFGSWTNAKSAIINLFTMLHYVQILRRNSRMAAFRNEYMHISEKAFCSNRELITIARNYDAFICGSDQIWHPVSDIDRCCAYFLGFVKKSEAIKISYAPSFGVSSISESFERQIAPWIKDFSALSVREETGRSFIENAADRTAQVVLDPTLLLTSNHWAMMKAPLRSKPPYILVYSTSQRGLFTELVKHVKKVTGLPIVVLAINSLNLISGADQVIYDASPQEFLGLFENASCVCTNSFHGTAFSLIFRRPFWGVPHSAANSRIADLLHRINLSTQQVCSIDDFPKNPLEIAYRKPAVLLEQCRQESIRFLTNALEYN